MKAIVESDCDLISAIRVRVKKTHSLGNISSVQNSEKLREVKYNEIKKVSYLQIL